ncbi:MAG: thioredoxin fold domain-containing protein [Candidatus Marinimicrobia bacterium]|jgi:thiol:disulfide interchange protein DsbD|nr:thioredoxin fold domain-containing protein [Candidatus Neomarinimicrobiota bacterium]MBT3501361.1 thioredoxin fold domain-containing protein [Candidatus Neomarinimicrobiota bacterium]MBT3839067.1 thioredoxin fold domain-containing protein [Candidatus Neomarinimicrobiota bacterium]MBT3998307.1 thioredoxin fold domain-containing protein [Candidatus Neomarinimicrobiota bacterium]MBT4283589.1 thioredoxin fold domain-containing protein [Candidatus Neomarinimicrobiota bacterium]
MKKTIIISFIILSTLIFASDKNVFSEMSLTEAQSISKIEGKPILIKFHADWCHNCVKMDQTTFKDTQVQSVLEKFIPVKIDVDVASGITIAQNFNISAIPVVILLDESGKEISRVVGYQSPKELVRQLSQANEK